ncbi:hypothetical protein C2G38_2087843 [Gigaspora rosea]|uniref:Uncharacterized protein n=1 Tax=Gigaspora rosea TaxID=44941 RepID=A0A397V8G8_9GLOM|nr:hypothetical protein C2G38_2087843 [Gigaspora rosea]
MVFHWNGSIIGNPIEFGSSYLAKDKSLWPNEFIVNNISPKKGFLRLSAINGIGTDPDSFKWSQFGYHENGSLYLLQSDTVSALKNQTILQVTAFATLDGGYALAYANTTRNKNFTTSNPLAAQFSADAAIYTIMLGYNQPTTPKSLILHQLTAPNLTFTQLYCSVDYVFIGHSCIAYASQEQFVPNVTTTVITTTTTPAGAAPTVVPITTTISTPSTTINSFYMRIRFLSSGSVLALDPIFPPNNGSLTNVRSLPLGGYAVINRTFFGQNINYTFDLYNESDSFANDYNFPLRPLTANLNGAFDILQNNTMLMALNETSTTSWRLLSINLPPLSPYKDNGFGNLHVSAAYPPKGFDNLTLNSNSISITYQDPIALSNGNLYIYQRTIDGNKTLRQVINTKSCNLNNSVCSVTDKVVKLNVLDCTFNDPNAQYYIEVDNGFVKSSIYNEPILGINQNTWTFNTTGGGESLKRAGTIKGSLRLTTDGTSHFETLNNADKDRFFDKLINELAILIPAEKGRLSSSGHYQKDTSDSTKTVIVLSISEAKSGGNQRISTEIESNLNLLIKNKEFTGISTEPTVKYLDETYGYQRFQSIKEVFESHKTKFILLFVAIVLFILIFLVARLRSPESENFCILTLGLTIFRFVTYVVFTFTDAPLVPNIFIPSVAFLVIPVAFNLALAFTILYSEKSDEYVVWFVQYGRVAVSFALASGANIDTLLILRARLMKIEMFNAPFSDRSLTTIFWGACVDVLLTEIPQFILQIIFLNSSVLFDVVPIFTAVASGLSVLASITSKIFFIRHKTYSPYLKHIEEKKRNTMTIDDIKVEKQTYDANEVVDPIDGK